MNESVSTSLTRRDADLASTLFVGEDHRKVWARLRRERGVRASMRRVLRIVREHGILMGDRPTGVRGLETHDRAIRPRSTTRLAPSTRPAASPARKTPRASGSSTGTPASAPGCAPRGTRFDATGCLRDAVHLVKDLYEKGIGAD